eukprot:30308-Pelagococcus_subviridis.AAC.9
MPRAQRRPRAPPAPRRSQPDVQRGGDRDQHVRLRHPRGGSRGVVLRVRRFPAALLRAFPRLLGSRRPAAAVALGRPRPRPRPRSVRIRGRGLEAPPPRLRAHDARAHGVVPRGSTHRLAAPFVPIRPRPVVLAVAAAAVAAPVAELRADRVRRAARHEAPQRILGEVLVLARAVDGVARVRAHGGSRRRPRSRIAHAALERRPRVAAPRRERVRLHVRDDPSNRVRRALVAARALAVVRAERQAAVLRRGLARDRELGEAVVRDARPRRRRRRRRRRRVCRRERDEARRDEEDARDRARRARDRRRHRDDCRTSRARSLRPRSRLSEKSQRRSTCTF